MVISVLPGIFPGALRSLASAVVPLGIALAMQLAH